MINDWAALARLNQMRAEAGEPACARYARFGEAGCKDELRTTAAG